MNADVQLPGQRDDFFKRAIGDGVRRMRCQRKIHPVLPGKSLLGRHRLA